MALDAFLRLCRLVPATAKSGKAMSRQELGLIFKEAEEQAFDAGQLLSHIVAQLPKQNTMDGEAAFEARCKQTMHDLRTPLNAVMGYGGLLGQKGIDDITRQKCLQSFHEAGQMMLDIIDHGFSAHGPLPTTGLSDANRVVKECLAMIEWEARERGIILFDRMGLADRQVAIDAPALKRVVLNLLSNALRYTDKGGAIEITSTANLDLVHIAITDTGCGMSEETLGRALIYGARGAEAEMRAPEGCGLGLSIAQELLALSGGKIALSSKQGGGTTATISLPSKQATSAHTAQPAADAAANLNHTQPNGTLPRRNHDTQRRSA